MALAVKREHEPTDTAHNVLYSAQHHNIQQNAKKMPVKMYQMFYSSCALSLSLSLACLVYWIKHHCQPAIYSVKTDCSSYSQQQPSENAKFCSNCWLAGETTQDSRFHQITRSNKPPLEELSQKNLILRPENHSKTKTQHHCVHNTTLILTFWWNLCGLIELFSRNWSLPQCWRFCPCATVIIRTPSCKQLV